MRASQAFLPTFREAPADAELTSHKLLVRGGFIRREAAGVYAYLPLGWRVLRKIENIVREEMNRAGAQELFMPVLVPMELLEQTGRDKVEVLFRVNDRAQRPFALGFTHEEVITDIFRHTVSSYRQLPLNLYQIQTKFRDEQRPRAGLIRGREFIMKDAYSFTSTQADLDEIYGKMRGAYSRSFSRMGLDTLLCEADPGDIGGSENHEFMVITAGGEDTVLKDDQSDYAANAERADVPDHYGDPVGAEGVPSVEVVSTPGAHTVTQVAEFLNVGSNCIVKTLLYMADDKPTAALVRGDRELNPGKLRRFLNADRLRMMEGDEVEMHSGAPAGFAGPVGMSGVRLIADNELKPMHDFVTGANKDQAHMTHVCHGRDFQVESWADIRVAEAGDPSPDGGMFQDIRGIEVGHIFQLGTKYSESMNAMVSDAEGKELPAIMGCYGLGISRCMAAIAEVCNDANGLVWPASVAPLEAIVIPAGPDDAVRQTAEEIYQRLLALGVETLLDDRDERAGVKFKDMDLIGWPVQVVVGRGVAEGTVEVGLRREGTRVSVPITEAAERVIELLAAEKQRLA